MKYTTQNRTAPTNLFIFADGLFKPVEKIEKHPRPSKTEAGEDTIRVFFTEAKK